MDIQNLIDKTDKNNLYLFFRLIIYFLLTVISIDSLYSVKNIDSTSYFNNLFLYSGPLFIEYIFGMDCYNKLSKRSKSIGFFISMILVLISIFGLFGIITIELNNKTHVIENIYLYKDSINFIGIIKFIPVISCICNLADWIFSYTSAELTYYSMHKEINEIIKENISQKGLDMIEKSKQKYKNEYKKDVLDVMKGDI